MAAFLEILKCIVLGLIQGVGEFLPISSSGHLLLAERMLGIDDEVGTLEAGKKANLIVIDDAVHVKKVILEGDLMVEDGKLL